MGLKSDANLHFGLYYPLQEHPTLPEQIVYLFCSIKSVRTDDLSKTLMCINFDLLFFWSSDISSVELLLLLAHFNSLTLLQPDENEACK